MFQYSVYPSLIYVIVFTLSFWTWFLFELWVVSRDRGKPQRGQLRGGRWLILGIAIGMMLAVNSPQFAPGLDIRAHFPAWFTLGIVLIWAGLIFRFWAIQTLGKFFSTRLVVQEHHELIRSGPYTYLRNPSYTGALVTFIGIGLAIGNWLSFGVLLLTSLVLYAWRIKIEEGMLAEAFGQAFQDYKQTSWALIPFIW